jgi:diacylglycerol kinase (ATP)
MSLHSVVERGTAALLVNPRARLATRRGWRESVRESLAKRFHLEFLFPRDPQETTTLARESALQGCDVVIAAGGDGTINVAARGLAGSGVPLGIIPLGTANDLARELGIPRDLAAASARIAGGVAHPMDLVEANGVPFCTVGGLALVADTTLLVSRLKRVAPALRRVVDAIGGGVYRLAATATLLGRRHLSAGLHIEYEDADDGTTRTIHGEAHALFVANHRTLGGGLVLPVATDANDGVFELCVVPTRSRASLVVEFSKLSAGRPLAPGVLTVARARRAVVHTEATETFVADGEVLSSGAEFEIGVKAGALKILV